MRLEVFFQVKDDVAVVEHYDRALRACPRERKRWFEFKDAQARQRVLDWLAEDGIRA